MADVDESKVQRAGMDLATAAATATEKSTAPRGAQHPESQLPREHKFQDQHDEGQSHAVPAQDACGSQQIPPLNDECASLTAAVPGGTEAHDDGSNESTEVQALDAVAAENSTAAAHAHTDARQTHQDSQDEEEHEDEEEVLIDLDPLQVESARRLIETVLNLLELDGYAHDDVIDRAVAATRRNLLSPFDELPSYRNGGFGAVPASVAAVASLEKRTFHAGGGGGGGDHDGLGGCAICLEDDFEEGQELSVMPCSKAHAFHTQCINVWLGQSNVCPLCRHPLPPATEDA